MTTTIMMLTLMMVLLLHKTSLLLLPLMTMVMDRIVIEMISQPSMKLEIVVVVVEDLEMKMMRRKMKTRRWMKMKLVPIKTASSGTEEGGGGTEVRVLRYFDCLCFSYSVCCVAS